MAGDGTSGQFGASGSKDGLDSASTAPSSQAQRRPLESVSGERAEVATDAFQPSGSAVRVGLEREGPRLPAVSRRERRGRKKARRSELASATAAVGGENEPTTQLESNAGRPLTVVNATDAEGSQEPASETPNDAEGAGAPTRRPRRKHSRSSVASVHYSPLRPPLAEAGAAWDEEVAAFVARGLQVPPLPYRPTDHAEAFELTAEQRRAIPEGQVRRLNTHPTQCVARALAVVPLLDEWRTRMACLPIKLSLVDLIPTLARALSHANARIAPALEGRLSDFPEIGETMSLTRREQLQRCLRQTLVERARLHSDIRNLITLGHLPRSALSNLKGGKGYSNVAFDVLTLLEVRRAALTASAPSAINDEDARRCAALAYALVEISARTPNGIDAVRAAALEERARAFTLLWLAYNEAERAFAFIFWNYGKRRVLPSLV